jgi:hypothetical protein
MSCYNNCYLPQPPRAWSRVQNSCSLTNDVNDGLVRNPITGELIPASLLGEKMAMLNKGNILQYKANSSNLTKAQRYSKIAQGKWTNRNTSWATQSTRGYTNPNTSSLKRSGNTVNIAIDPITGAVIGQTYQPVTCTQTPIPVNEGLPGIASSGPVIPPIPPPIEPEPTSEGSFAIIDEAPIEPIVIQDEGTLICSVQENICTGETKRSLSQQLCNLTTDSDVPGTIQELCWKDGTPTWYPRQRYIMSNSANKWPVNAQLASAVRPPPPVISGVVDRYVITLTWTQNNNCIPVTQFYIFENNTLISTVPGTQFTIDITNICGFYQYFIIAGTSGNVVSEPSNIISINVSYVGAPLNLAYTTTGLGSIQLTWSAPDPSCEPAVSYNIYEGGSLIGNTTNLYYDIIGLTNCSNYTFSVSSVDAYGNESYLSILTNVIPLWLSPPTNLTYITIASGSVQLNWTGPDPSTICSPPFSYNIYNVSGTVIGNTSSTSYNIIGLTNCANYTFSVSTVDADGNESALITIINVIPLWPNPPTNLTYITTASGSIQLTWSAPITTCGTLSYNIYGVGGSIGNTSNTYYDIIGLTNCSNYTFSVSSVYPSGAESSLVPLDVIPLWPNPPTNLAASLTSDLSSINLSWSAPNPNCSLPISYTLYWSTDNSIFNSIPNIAYGTTSYNFTGVSLNTRYYFYMVSVNLVGTSVPTTTINILNSIYVVTGDINNYRETINGNTHTLRFYINDITNTDGIFNILFNVSLSNVYFTLIGGGGGGGGSGYYDYNTNQEWMVVGVGGGGASSIITYTDIAASNSFGLVVGYGGKGGLAGTSTPNIADQYGSPGNLSSVTGTSFTASAPGGKASNTILSVSSGIGNVYYAEAVPQSDVAESTGTIVQSKQGGGTTIGSGISRKDTGGEASLYIVPDSGGNGYDSTPTPSTPTPPTDSLLCGGGGGSPQVEYNAIYDTITGSVVSLTNIGGLSGQIIAGKNTDYLPGNQDQLGYGDIQEPGSGSGGGGGGMYWSVGSSNTFGKGGKGGNGFISITFTYP